MKVSGFDTIIIEGRKGMKLEIFLFNPSVPESYKQRALNMLECFMDIGAIEEQDIRYISGSVGAYLENGIDEHEKYFLTLNVFIRNEGHMEDCFFESPILPGEEGFPEFRKCVMGELRDLVFG